MKKMTVKVYDYDNKSVEIEIPAKDVSEIEAIFVTVLSGDETGFIVLKNGKEIEFDASGCRIHSFLDGCYVIRGDAIAKWIDAKPSDGRTFSYQRHEMFTLGYKEGDEDDG